MTKTVRVAAGIIQRTGSDGANEVLAVQRGYGTMAGLWEFPGGKVEAGETPAEACARELQEELRIEITNLQDFYTLEYDYPDFHLSMNCFFCSMTEASDEPQAHDRQRALRWVRRTSLAELTWMPADVELVQVLESLEHRNGNPLIDNTESDTVSIENAPKIEEDTIETPGKPHRRASPRRKRAKTKRDLLDGVDATGLDSHDIALIRRRAAIRKTMQGNKRRNTKPELLVRQRLRAAGFRGYRLDWAKAPGRPDIAYPGRKIAIFVNGCYWHRCPKCNPSQPKKNIEFWKAKFRRNVERDRRAIAELEKLGWTVLTVWECELKRDRIDETMAHVIDRIGIFWNERDE